MKKHLLSLALAFVLSQAVPAQTILGVDVSHYDSDAPYGAENWTNVKGAGKKFAWNKSTQGVTYTDPSFVTNMVNGHAAGVVMGAYHFADAETNTAVAEANYFVSVAGAYIGPGYLPPVLDLEDPSSGPALSSYFTSAALTTWVQTFMTTVQNSTGVTPVIYTSASYAGYLNSSLNHYGLWIANPNTSATTAPTNIGNWTTWMFKQYSWTGTVAGIGSNGSAQVDLDVFNGDTTAFNTLIGGSPVTVSFSSNIQSGCMGMQVNFTDHSTSTGTITGHSWTFAGGSPPTSTSANPTVTYNTAGTYSVKEVVTSSTGKDSTTMTSYISVTGSSSLPLVQTFQSATFPPTGWTMHYSAVGDSAWELCTNNGYNSSQCMYFPANCGYVTSTAGQRQQIYTPNYSFVGTTSPQMWFDVAYEPYNRKYSDTLAVYSSLDCGTTWNLLYLKGGMTLCTTGSTDSLGTDTSGGHGCFIPPNAGAWRTDSINLSSLTGNASVMFSFESRSGWGNILYLDNINVASTICTPPTASISAGGPTTFCQGGSVTLTAGTANTYLWSNGATTPGISATTAGNYTVVVSNGGGCSATSTATAVTVNPLPTVSVSGAPNPQCANQPVTLTATGNGASYQWSGSGLQSNSGTSVNAVVATAGNQTYTVTATLSGCSASATAMVGFNTSVVPAVSITQTTSNPVCAGAQVSFSATSNGGGTNPVYQWTTSNNQTGTGNSFTISSAQNGETVRCLLISNAGCASPDSVYSASLTVNTQSPQPVTLLIATPDSNVCSGENVAFTSSVTNGGSSPTYTWYVNGSSSGTGSGYTLNNIQVAASVYCVVTSSSGCVTGSPATSNTLNVRIQNSAQASVSVTADPNPVCAGAPVTFMATPGNGGSSPVYSWQLNGSTVGTNSTTFSNASPHNGDAVSCNMTSSATCVSNQNVVSNTINVQVNPLPVANAGTAFHVSPSSSVILGGNPTGSGGTAPYGYVWSPANGLSSAGVSNPIESGISSNTIYTVVVTDANGCSASDTVGVYLINCNLPSPTVQLNLCDIAAQNLPAVSYQWYLQNNLLSGATSRFYSASQSGYYYVRVADTVGCTAQSPDVFVNYPACLNTGIEALNDNPSFEVYPNPAYSELTLSFTNPSGSAFHVEMIDLVGQIVYRSEGLNIITGSKFTIPVAALAAGPYLVRVANEDGRFVVKRVVKM